MQIAQLQSLEKSRTKGAKDKIPRKRRRSESIEESFQKVRSEIADETRQLQVLPAGTKLTVTRESHPLSGLVPKFQGTWVREDVAGDPFWHKEGTDKYISSRELVSVIGVKPSDFGHLNKSYVSDYYRMSESGKVTFVQHHTRRDPVTQDLKFHYPEEWKGLPVEYVSTLSVMDHREFDRDPHEPRSGVPDLVESIKEHGIREPLIITYYKGDKTAVLTEGNHRLAAAIELGLPAVPVRVIRSDNTRSAVWRSGEGRRVGPKVKGFPTEDGYVPGDLYPSDIGIVGVKEKRSWRTHHEEMKKSGPTGPGSRGSTNWWYDKNTRKIRYGTPPAGVENDRISTPELLHLIATMGKEMADSADTANYPVEHHYKAAAFQKIRIILRDLYVVVRDGRHDTNTIFNLLHQYANKIGGIEGNRLRNMADVVRTHKFWHVNVPRLQKAVLVALEDA